MSALPFNAARMRCYFFRLSDNPLATIISVTHIVKSTSVGGGDTKRIWISASLRDKARRPVCSAANCLDNLLAGGDEPPMPTQQIVAARNELHKMLNFQYRWIVGLTT